MLVSERTHMGEQPVGTLVTLDKVFELVEGNLSSERQKDISDITERFRGDSADQGWAARTAKAICLLEFVRDLPRTPANIAAMLVDRVESPSPVAQVEAALERLKQAQERYGRPFKCAAAELPREILVKPRASGELSLGRLGQAVEETREPRAKARPRRPSSFRFGGR